jgi:SHS2 domain-containing protein
MSYRVLDHTADYMVEVSGRTREELFAEAARAFFDTLTEVGSVRPEEAVEVRVRADDEDQLLATWLDELLFLHESEGWLFCDFRFRRLGERELEAEAWGERFDPARHAIDREIKAVTYHRLGLRREGDLLKTTIVFDL